LFFAFWFNQSCLEKLSPSGSGSSDLIKPAQNGKSALEGRFGSRLQPHQEEPEEETTIGFGANAKPVSTVFINTGGSSRFNGGFNGKSAAKTVSFSAANVNGNSNGKMTSLNTSNSTTDSNCSDENDENGGQLSEANLFVGEKERKKYLEDQFQESVGEYTKVLKRLEHADLLH
jgi:hypothetical protein